MRPGLDHRSDRRRPVLALRHCAGTADVSMLKCTSSRSPSASTTPPASSSLHSIRKRLPRHRRRSSPEDRLFLARIPTPAQHRPPRRRLRFAEQIPQAATPKTLRLFLQRDPPSAGPGLRGLFRRSPPRRRRFHLVPTNKSSRACNHLSTRIWIRSPSSLPTRLAAAAPRSSMPSTQACRSGYQHYRASPRADPLHRRRRKLQRPRRSRCHRRRPGRRHPRLRGPLHRDSPRQAFCFQSPGSRHPPPPDHPDRRHRLRRPPHRPVPKPSIRSPKNSDRNTPSATTPPIRANDGSFRKVVIEPVQPGLTVRARAGYYASPPPK